MPDNEQRLTIILVEDEKLHLHSDFFSYETSLVSRHSRMLLAGIHKGGRAGFPPKTRGNDPGVKLELIKLK